MKFKILTLFPEMFPGPLGFSIIGKALKKKKNLILKQLIYEISQKKNQKQLMTSRLEVEQE